MKISIKIGCGGKEKTIEWVKKMLPSINNITEEKGFKVQENKLFEFFKKFNPFRCEIVE